MQDYQGTESRWLQVQAAITASKAFAFGAGSPAGLALSSDKPYLDVLNYFPFNFFWRWKPGGKGGRYLWVLGRVV